jgi:hypothetical protein
VASSKRLEMNLTVPLYSLVYCRYGMYKKGKADAVAKGRLEAEGEMREEVLEKWMNDTHKEQRAAAAARKG